MAEQTGKRRHRAWGGFTLFDDGIAGWLRLRGRVGYRKVLILLVVTIALYTGANMSTVLEWLKSLLALLGIR